MRRPLALAVVAAVSACASTPKTRSLDPTRPIEIEERRFRPTAFKQEGVPLDNVELLSALVATPEGRDHIRAASREGTRALGLLLVATGLTVGAFTADGSSAQAGLLAGAAASLGVGLYFNHRAGEAGVAAARAYNASLQAPAPPSTSGRAPPPRAPGPSLSLSLRF